MESVDAVVVGSGPNGLAAALTLAMAGRSVHIVEAAERPGGGLVSVQGPDSGVLIDHCSAVHPLGVASPFLRSLIDDAAIDVDWLTADVEFAQPLDGGRAALVSHDLERTAEAMGADAARYRRLLGPVVAHLDDILSDVLAPPLHLPGHPISYARFALRAPWPFTWLSRLFRDEPAPAALAGCAAHALVPLSRPLTAAFAVLFAATAHHRRWPAVAGGTGALADALLGAITDRGATIETGRRVCTMDDLPPHRVALFDTNPAQVAAIAGDRLGSGAIRKLRRFRHGPGVFKVDYVLDEPVPWTNDGCRDALTVHVGGTAAEVTAAELAVARGQHPDRPFVLTAQPSVVDPTRAPDGRHVFWAYCHVPAASAVDRTAAIEDQLERFAPGFRDVVRHRVVTSSADLEAGNPNLVGGDIGGGSLGGLQALFRPRLTRHPYDTADPSIFLCSASTPPGAGVHGMCGHLAAQRVLQLGR